MCRVPCSIVFIFRNCWQTAAAAVQPGQTQIRVSSAHPERRSTNARTSLYAVPNAITFYFSKRARSCRSLARPGVWRCDAAAATHGSSEKSILVAQRRRRRRRQCGILSSHTRRPLMFKLMYTCVRTSRSPMKPWLARVRPARPAPAPRGRDATAKWDFYRSRSARMNSTNETTAAAVHGERERE